MQYPVSGIEGFEVSSLEMTESGPKYDRMWAIVKASNMKHIGLPRNTETLLFNQEFIYDGDQPKALKLICGTDFITVPLERSYDKSDLIEASRPQEKI